MQLSEMVLFHFPPRQNDILVQSAGICINAQPQYIWVVCNKPHQATKLIT